MKRITATLIAPLLVGGIFFLILVYVADFSARQSIALALILMFMGRYVGDQVKKLNERIEKAVEKPSYKFAPYHIRIDPQWQQLLIDFKLIGSAEEWAQIKETVYEALPYGISCTILQKQDEWQEDLIFRGPILGSFVRIFEFEDVIAPIQFEEAPRELRLFVKPGADGYDLGIIVPEKWWDGVKTSCPKPLKERNGEMWYETELTLATLSYAEFGWYWQPENGAGPGNLSIKEPQYNAYEEWSQQITSQRDEQRIKLGWKEAKYGGPNRIEHSYFEVVHNHI
jgi:hypothetical protein